MTVDLDAVRAIAGAMGARPWFTRLGVPLTGDELALTQVAAGGYRVTGVDVVPDLAAAKALVLDPAGAAAADADAVEARVLRDRAVAAAGERAVLGDLSAIVDASLEPTIAAARTALAAASIADDEFARVLAGAAALAAYHAALAKACGMSDHAFVAIDALFARGRWPLGPHAGRFAVL
ncbi:MAG TPA: hypothetical protein VMD91_14915 [Candidatus Sulfotelmatobacter sp.]|nr:hypothetical protein [Candidatus Sulfotelmatobacter sp.]